jgi:hypothetical protein
MSSLFQEYEEKKLIRKLIGDNPKRLIDKTFYWSKDRWTQSHIPFHRRNCFIIATVINTSIRYFYLDKDPDDVYSTSLAYFETYASPYYPTEEIQ